MGGSRGSGVGSRSQVDYGKGRGKADRGLRGTGPATCTGRIVVGRYQPNQKLPPRSRSICSLRRSVKKPLGLASLAPLRASEAIDWLQPGKPSPLSDSQYWRGVVVQPAVQTAA